MQKLVTLFTEKCLRPCLCDCRKGFSAHQALIALIERWTNILDQKGYGGTVLMGLPKVFDTLNHDLMNF